MSEPQYDWEFNYETEWDFYVSYCIMGLELGLRWLNDRAAETRHRRQQRARQDPSGRWFR